MSELEEYFAQDMTNSVAIDMNDLVFMNNEDKFKKLLKNEGI